MTKSVTIIDDSDPLTCPRCNNYHAADLLCSFCEPPAPPHTLANCPKCDWSQPDALAFLRPGQVCFMCEWDRAGAEREKNEQEEKKRQKEKKEQEEKKRREEKKRQEEKNEQEKRRQAKKRQEEKKQQQAEKKRGAKNKKTLKKDKKPAVLKAREPRAVVLKKGPRAAEKLQLPDDAPSSSPDPVGSSSSSSSAPPPALGEPTFLPFHNPLKRLDSKQPAPVQTTHTAPVANTTQRATDGDQQAAKEQTTGLSQGQQKILDREAKRRAAGYAKLRARRDAKRAEEKAKKQG